MPHAMQCYVMLLFVTCRLFYAMMYYVMLRFDMLYYAMMCYVMLGYGRVMLCHAMREVRRSRVVTFAAIRLRGPGFKLRPRQKFEARFLLHSHPSGGEGVSPVQGEAIRRRYIKPEYLPTL